MNSFSRTKKSFDEVAKMVIGMPIVEAEVFIAERGLSYRIETAAPTIKYSIYRITLVVVGDKVFSAVVE